MIEHLNEDKKEIVIVIGNIFKVLLEFFTETMNEYLHLIIEKVNSYIFNFKIDLRQFGIKKISNVKL